MNHHNRPPRRPQTPRKRRRRLTPPGTAPGTLTPHQDAPASKIQCLAFGPGGVTETNLAAAAEVPPLADGQTVRWINVDGLGDIEAVRRIGLAFGLHPLALEDIVDALQRPKVDAYEDHLLIITRMPVGNPAEGGGPGERLETEQVAICLGRDFVVTFQEQPGDAFDPVRRRLCAADGRFRAHGADYLAYALIDAALDISSRCWKPMANRSRTSRTRSSDGPRSARSVAFTISSAIC